MIINDGKMYDTELSWRVSSNKFSYQLTGHDEVKLGWIFVFSLSVTASVKWLSINGPNITQLNFVIEFNDPLSLIKFF